MQKFDHIEALWATHTVDLKISSDDMLKQAKREVNTMRTKSVLNIIGMILSLVTVTCLWLYDFKSWTTHAGISIIIIAIAVYTIILYNNYRIIAKIDITQNPAMFIDRLKHYRVNRYNLYNRLYWFYAFALSAGMALYFYELLADLSFYTQFIIIGLSFGWIIFCSTVIRKAVIKKDKERINRLIEKFEHISEQLR